MAFGSQECFSKFRIENNRDLWALEQKAACADANIYSVMARAGQNHGKELFLK